MPFPVWSLDGATSPFSVPAAPGAPSHFSHIPLFPHPPFPTSSSNPGFKNQTRKIQPFPVPGTGSRVWISSLDPVTASLIPGWDGMECGKRIQRLGLGLPLGFFHPWNWGELAAGGKAAGNSGWCVFPVSPIPRPSSIPGWNIGHSLRKPLSFGGVP